MRSCYLFFAAFFFLTATTANAKSSDLFSGYLAEKIYKGCIGNNIEIKSGFLKYNDNDLTLLKNGQYTQEVLRQVIQELSKTEPYDDYYAGCEHQNGDRYTSGRNGCGILTCSEHKLDINKYVYFWDGERVDVPKEEFTTVYGDNIETYGNESPVTTGDKSPVNKKENNIWIQLFWSKGTVAGTFVGILLKILYDIVKLKLKTTKRVGYVSTKEE